MTGIYDSNGTSLPITPDTGDGGYFYYPSLTYAGIDLRFTSWLGTGNFMQMIFSSSTPLYTGPAGTPVLSLIDLAENANFYYYPAGSSSNEVVGIVDGHYSDIAVPEPTALLFLSLALPLMTVVLRKGRASQRPRQ